MLPLSDLTRGVKRAKSQSRSAFSKSLDRAGALGVVFVQIRDAYLRAFPSEEESCLPPGPRGGPDGDR
jgi:hypothetical protein